MEEYRRDENKMGKDYLIQSFEPKLLKYVIPLSFLLLCLKQHFHQMTTNANKAKHDAPIAIPI